MEGDSNILASVPSGSVEETTIKPSDSTSAIADNAGETDDEKGHATEGESEQGEHKRTGYQRLKAQKERLARENEALRELAFGQKKPAVEKPAEEVKPSVSEKPVRPKLDDFATYDEYEQAKDDYYEKLADWKAEEKLAERDQKIKDAEAKSKQEAEQKTLAQKWTERLDTARDTIDDFDDVAFNPKTMKSVDACPALGHAVITSEVGAELAYFLGQHPEEAERLSKLPGEAVFREIGKLEVRLAKDKPEATEEAEKPAAPPVSKAPKPPSTVSKSSGNVGTITDPLEAATKGDYATFEKLMNKRR